MMSTPHTPRQSQLLAALAAADYERVLPVGSELLIRHVQVLRSNLAVFIGFHLAVT
jgi:hypothetical protein